MGGNQKVENKLAPPHPRVCRLAGWLVGWLAGWQAGWLAKSRQIKSKHSNHNQSISHHIRLAEPQYKIISSCMWSASSKSKQIRSNSNQATFTSNQNQSNPNHRKTIKKNAISRINFPTNFHRFRLHFSIIVNPFLNDHWNLYQNAHLHETLWVAMNS